MLKMRTLWILLLAFPLDAAAQTLHDTSPSGQTGQQVYGSYFSAEVDAVSLYNGNVNINLPLFSLGGRELPVGVSVSYNSLMWASAYCGGTPCARYTGGWRVVTPFPTESLSLYKTYAGCDYISGQYRPRFTMNAFWIDGAGTKHRYTTSAHGTSGLWWLSGCVGGLTEPGFDSLTLNSLDSDGSFIYTGEHESNGTIPAYMQSRDGSTRYFRTTANSSYVPHDIVTANGNTLVQGSNGLPTQDTLGRTVQFECVSPCSGSDIQHRYKIYDSNGTLQTYKIQFQALNLEPNPINSSPYAMENLISWIELPNGKRYTFDYNATFGFVEKVTLPSGGYVRYVYGHPSYGFTKDYQYATQRIVSSDGTSGSEKTWTYSGFQQSGYNSPASITVTHPEGNKDLHHFSVTGTEYETQWQTSAGAPLKTVQISWEQSAVEANGQPNNPKVTTTTTIMGDGAISRKQIAYDSDNRPTQEKVYEWGTGQTLVLQKDITYTTISGIHRRVASETLTATNPANDSWTTQGKTEYFYDDYSLTDRGSGVPNHTHSTTASGLRCAPARMIFNRRSIKKLRFQVRANTGRGNLTKVRKYKDASNYLETQMKYDNLGNLIETIDPLSHSTTIDFTRGGEFIGFLEP